MSRHKSDSARIVGWFRTADAAAAEAVLGICKEIVKSRAPRATPPKRKLAKQSSQSEEPISEYEEPASTHHK